MPDPYAAFGIALRDRRRQDGRTVQVHVGATACTNGTASALRRSWDMQQAQSPFACGTQAYALRPRLLFSVCFDTRGQLTRVAPRRRYPCRSARPFGGKGTRTTGEPWNRTNHGVMTCVWTSHPLPDGLTQMLFERVDDLVQGVET
jgi:hypothetical protein